MSTKVAPREGAPRQPPPAKYPAATSTSPTEARQPRHSKDRPSRRAHDRPVFARTGTRRSSPRKLRNDLRVVGQRDTPEPCLDSRREAKCAVARKCGRRPSTRRLLVGQQSYSRQAGLAHKRDHGKRIVGRQAAPLAALGGSQRLPYHRKAARIPARACTILRTRPELESDPADAVGPINEGARHRAAVGRGAGRKVRRGGPERR